MESGGTVEEKKYEEKTNRLTDGNNRVIDYMRLSVTDRCNLNCIYCMPKKDRSLLPNKEILSWEEMYKVCKIMSEIGIKKIKITGGEPLAREGVIDFIRDIKTLPNIECVTLTTNGILLKNHLYQLKIAGIDGINVSMDSMDCKSYKTITGYDSVKEVLNAIKLSVEYSIPTKINCVVLKGINDKEIMEFVKLTKEYPIVVRFIEMMPLGEGNHFQPISGLTLKKDIEMTIGNLNPVNDIQGNGPAIYYRGEGFLGSIGFINAVSQCFCSRCNRIRMSADGQLKLCLSHSDSWDMKKALREQKKEEEIKSILRQKLKSKPISHDFQIHTKEHEVQSMWKIGG